MDWETPVVIPNHPCPLTTKEINMYMIHTCTICRQFLTIAKNLQFDTRLLNPSYGFAIPYPSTCTHLQMNWMNQRFDILNSQDVKNATFARLP